MDGLAPLLRQAQAGDQKVRGELVNTFRPFVRQVASACCRRPLQWGNDDELSVALIALDEAITTFREDAGRQFPNHARQVIIHRLIDFFRQQRRHQHLSLEAMLQATEEVSATLEVKAAWDVFRAHEEERQRRSEIMEYSHILVEYGLTLTVLKEHCPKHKDTRQHLLQIAHGFAKQRGLVDHLTRTKQLPLKEIELLTGASRKVLDTHRRYLIALILLIVHRDLEMLQSFAGVSREGGGDEWRA